MTHPKYRPSVQLQKLLLHLDDLNTGEFWVIV